MWRHRQYLGGFEGVVRCEGDVQEEDASLVHGARWSQDGRPPLIDVVSFRASTAESETQTLNHWVIVNICTGALVFPVAESTTDTRSEKVPVRSPI